MAKVIHFFKHLSVFIQSRIYRFGLILVGLALCLALPAQKTIISSIQYVDAPHEKPITTITDSIKVPVILQNHINQLNASGYIYAHIDTSYYVADSCFSHIFRGKKYHISDIILNDEQRTIIEASNIKKLPIGKSLDSITVYSFLKAIVKHQVNNGYPFAKVKLTDIHFNDEAVSAGLEVYKGKYITFDSVVLSGKLDMSPDFFSKLLDIRSGKYYEHDKILKAPSKLKNLPFLSMQSAPYVRFINDRASVILPLDPKPSSRFDFLIGVLPQTVNGARKWTITGDLIAEMNNAFKGGEYIFFQFKRLQADNLELLIKNTIPYLFKLPIGSHLDFRIFKNKNINLDTYFDGGFQWLYNGYNNIKFFGSYRASSLLEINIDQIKSSKKLPANLDFSYSGLGTGISIENLNYKYNPTSGYNASLSTVVGRKKIIPNRQIVDIENFADSYDTLKLNTLQAEIKAHITYYTVIKNWATIKMGLQSGLLYNENTLRTNELMRIGGNRLLRGFDEESILTDFYGFGTFEFRLIFDQNSYMSLPFVDIGYVKIRGEDGISELKSVIGLGLGLNFDTAAGIFNLSFAAGRAAPNSLDFSRMKIHFGYINLF